MMKFLQILLVVAVISVGEDVLTVQNTVADDLLWGVRPIKSIGVSHMRHAFIIIGQESIDNVDTNCKLPLFLGSLHHVIRDEIQPGIGNLQGDLVDSVNYYPLEFLDPDRELQKAAHELLMTLYDEVLGVPLQELVEVTKSDVPEVDTMFSTLNINLEADVLLEKTFSEVSDIIVNSLVTITNEMTCAPLNPEFVRAVVSYFVNRTYEQLDSNQVREKLLDWDISEEEVTRYREVMRIYLDRRLNYLHDLVKLSETDLPAGIDNVTIGLLASVIEEETGMTLAEDLVDIVVTFLLNDLTPEEKAPGHLERLLLRTLTAIVQELDLDDCQTTKLALMLSYIHAVPIEEFKLGFHMDAPRTNNGKNPPQNNNPPPQSNNQSKNPPNKPSNAPPATNPTPSTRQTTPPAATNPTKQPPTTSSAPEIISHLEEIIKRMLSRQRRSVLNKLSTPVRRLKDHLQSTRHISTLKLRSGEDHQPQNVNDLLDFYTEEELLVLLQSQVKFAEEEVLKMMTDLSAMDQEYILSLFPNTAPMDLHQTSRNLEMLARLPAAIIAGTVVKHIKGALKSHVTTKPGLEELFTSMDVALISVELTGDTLLEDVLRKLGMHLAPLFTFSVDPVCDLDDEEIQALDTELNSTVSMVNDYVVFLKAIHTNLGLENLNSSADKMGEMLISLFTFKGKSMGWILRNEPATTIIEHLMIRLGMLKLEGDHSKELI